MIPALSAPLAAPKQLTPTTIKPPEPDTIRAPREKDAPTGPPPSFEESLLARQAREALKPPDIMRNAEGDRDAIPSSEARAEKSFAELRSLAAEPEKPLMDKLA